MDDTNEILEAKVEILKRFFNWLTENDQISEKETTQVFWAFVEFLREVDINGR